MSYALRNFRRRLADLFPEVQFVFTTVVPDARLGYLWHHMFIMVPRISRGHVSDSQRHGNRSDVGKGCVLIPPWDRVYLYEVHYTAKGRSISTLSDEGLTLELVSWCAPCRRGHAQVSAKDIGPGTSTTLIRPEIGRISTARRQPADLIRCAMCCRRLPSFP